MIRPTSVQKFSRCPTLWYLEDVEGWRKPGEFNPKLLMGSAIHAAIATYWKSERDPILGAVEGERMLRGEWIDGHGLEVEAYVSVLHSTLKVVWKWLDKEMALCEPILVEHSIGEDGHTTPDLVTREGGDLVVTDWKSSYEVKPEHIHYRLEGAERDHQFWTYIDGVSSVLGEDVKRFRKVVIVCLPKPMVRAVTFEVTYDAWKSWAYNADAKMDAMDLIQKKPNLLYRREEGCLPYGEKHPCPMYEACWVAHGDRNQMMNLGYTKETRNGD